MKIKVESIEKVLVTEENIVHNEVNKSNLQLWHERLAHQNFAHIKVCLKNNNINIKDDCKNVFSDACDLGKMKSDPFPVSEYQTSRVGEIIHLDLCDPMEENSIGGARYFLLFKDDFSQYVTLYFLKSKTEVKDCFINYMQRLENETQVKINIFRTDNGLEFVNREMKEILFANGIKHQRTVVYTPQQNGKAERENRTLVEAARTMLSSKNLPKNLWAEAVNTAAYVLNRSRKTRIPNKTPYELWYRRETDIKYFKVFGTEAYVHIDKSCRKKWDVKSRLGIFVGYDDCIKGFRILTSANKIEVLRDVLFKDESVCRNTIVLCPKLMRVVIGQ